MSSREKNLLIIMGAALFIILNLLAFSQFYEPKKNEAILAKSKAEADFNQKQTVLSLREELEPERRWLESTGEVVTTIPLAQSQLLSLVEKQAASRGLDQRGQQILTAIPGGYYDRVRVQFKCTGMEDKIQQWIFAIHQPKQRQVVTKLELKPQSNDLTRVECTVEVEKWIITEKDPA